MREKILSRGKTPNRDSNLGRLVEKRDCYLCSVELHLKYCNIPDHIGNDPSSVLLLGVPDVVAEKFGSFQVSLGAVGTWKIVGLQTLG